MPNICEELPDTERSVFRPVVLEVVRQLCAITGIPSSINILFPEDIEENYQPGSTMQEQVTEERDRTTTPFYDHLKIQVEENPFMENMMDLTTSRKANDIPIFIDHDLRASIRPVKSTKEVKLTIEYVAANRSAAVAWKNRMNERLMNYGDIHLHEASYSYILPKTVVDVLYHIHALREANEGYGQSFEEYLSEKGSARITVVANQSGAARSLAVAEKQVRIQGLYDFTVSPEKAEKGQNSASWITTFTYTFTYDKPIQCNIHYPLMVHNQQVDSRFIPQIDSVLSHDYDKKSKSFSNTGAANYYFEAQNQLDIQTVVRGVVTIPEYDEFTPVSVVASTYTLMTALCSVDPNDKRAIVNLSDMTNDDSGFILDEDILDWLKAGAWRWLTVPYKLPLHLSLYSNCELLNADEITCDQNLNIRSKNDLSLRNVYQLRLSIVTDIDSIDIMKLKELKAFPNALIKLLLTMQVKMSDLKFLAPRVDLTQLMKPYLTDTGTDMYHIRMNTMQSNTVMINYVAAKKAATFKKS